MSNPDPLAIQPNVARVSAPAILLLGEPGAGKTFSIATLAMDPRIDKLFYLYTDPGGDESLLDAFQFYEAPIEKLHWHYVPPASSGWDTLQELSTKVTSMSYESLAGLKQGINKADHRQMFEIIGALGNFHCQRTGESYGDASTWPETYAVVFDSLTGLNRIAKESTVGAKPSLHQGEWGVAMSMEENFIRKFVADIRGPRVMIGHVDKTMDELAGRMTFQVALLGNKLAPHVPHLFSDVIFASSTKQGFNWATMDDRIALKSRNLPQSEKIKPNFRPILDKWQERKKFAETATAPKEGTPT